MQISKPIECKDLRIGYYDFLGKDKDFINNKKERGEIIPYNWDYKLKSALRLFVETEDTPIFIPTNIFINDFLKSNFDIKNYREFVESIFIDMSYECVTFTTAGTCLEMTTLTIKDNIYTQLAIKKLFTNTK